MKRFICILPLACMGIAHAQTTIDDFSAGSSPYVLPTDGDYTTNDSSISGPLFDSRDLSGSGYVGNGNDLFISSIGGGMLTSQGSGTAGGEMDLTYFKSSGEANLSGFQSITVTISNLTAPVDLGWGVYSDRYANESVNNFEVSSAGTVTLDFSTLKDAPVDLSKIDSLFINIDVTPGQSISISKIAANPAPVPEPAPLAAMGIGAGMIGLRRRKRQLSR